jgi:phage host-nuclease inhibitor protein Gam
MNDEIAAITKRYQPKLEDLTGRIETLQKGVQTYCEAHRDELTNGGKRRPPTWSPATCCGASARRAWRSAAPRP